MRSASSLETLANHLALSSAPGRPRKIGDVGTLIDAGAREARELLEPLIDAFIEAGSADGIVDAVSAFNADPLEALLLETIGVATLAGDLMIREGQRSDPLIALAEGSGTPFVDLPWADAVEEFRKRGNVTDEDLATLLEGIAFTSREERQRMLETIQQTTLDKLATAVSEGETYEDFAEALRTETVPLGITADDDSYLQMVFRTNVQGAYSAGRDRASKDPEILELRPYALYLTAGDSFVRSEHAEYAERNNGVYRIGSPEWEAVRPPPKDSPFNCRCSWVTLTREEALERGAEV